jgi:Tfp pilus assembly protein PilO
VVLSKRERYIGLITGSVLVVVLVFQFMVSPMLSQRETLDAQIADANQRLSQDRRLIRDGKNARIEMSKIAGQALRKDASETESQIVNAVSNWARESGMAPPSFKPERSEKEKDFNKLTYRATGGGTMSQISRFLYRIQTATIPVRITELTITSRKEGIDDLSLSLGIATIYNAEAPKPAAGASAASASAAREVTP